MQAGFRGEWLGVIVGNGGREWVRLAQTSASCTLATTTRALVRWSAAFEPTKVWVGDAATHFKNYLIAMLAEAVRVNRHFAMAHAAWTS